MKKRSILNLIRYHTEGNDCAFRNEAYEIAKSFDSEGNLELAEYIMSLLSPDNTFVPQDDITGLHFCKKVNIGNAPLYLPDVIRNDVFGIVNAIVNKSGVNKFLFIGAPGSGKTETVKQIARLTTRELYIVDFNLIIDSRLGQTAKNIALLFDEINSILSPDKIIVLFDEIDSIALDRTNSNDLREMGRATSAILKGLDSLKDSIILIATTNLYKNFDKALVRRFDATVNFSRYFKEDISDTAKHILEDYMGKFKTPGRNMKLFEKIVNLSPQKVYPGDLKNLIKTSLAFSKPSDEYDYLKRFYCSLIGEPPKDVSKLHSEGFTVREIEILTGISKSEVSRRLSKK